MTLPRSLSWAHLRNRHPHHVASYWRQLRALMAGGKRLLDDPEAMTLLFPQHPYEEDVVYKARRARAFNIPYAGEIVGDLVGQLAQDPPAATAEPAGDGWYDGTFMDDMDRKGLTSLGYAQAMAREALTTCTAWSLVEMPKPPEPGVIASLADQEKEGLLRAYVCPLASESVIDWEDDDDGELLWACVWKCQRKRPGPGDNRALVTDVFTFYDREGWARFEVTYDPDKSPPKDEDGFTAVDAGAHSFEAVPLVRFTLPEGLWAMDKLYGAARAHFQQRSAFSYAQVRGLFPLLTAFLGPEMGGGGTVPSEAQQDPQRATNQVYGMGRVMVFGQQDKLTYTSPPADVYAVAAKDLDTLRDEMHRVCAAMANSTDGSSAAVGRSGDSKAQDKQAKELVLAHIGTMLCDHLRDVLQMVSTGRGDALKWGVTGFRKFDQVTGTEAADSATAVQLLAIPSPTFKRVFLTATARRIVAHDATPEQLETIGEEIEENVTDEEFMPMPGAPGVPPVVPGQRPPAGGPAVRPAAGAPVVRPAAPKTRPAKKPARAAS